MSRIFDVVYWATMDYRDLYLTWDHVSCYPERYGRIKCWLFRRIYRIREWCRRFAHVRTWYGWRCVIWLACLPVYWVDQKVDRRFRAFRRWGRGKLVFWHLRRASHWVCRQFERLYLPRYSDDLPF